MQYTYFVTPNKWTEREEKNHNTRPKKNMNIIAVNLCATCVNVSTAIDGLTKIPCSSEWEWARKNGTEVAWIEKENIHVCESRFMSSQINADDNKMEISISTKTRSYMSAVDRQAYF